MKRLLLIIMLCISLSVIIGIGKIATANEYDTEKTVIVKAGDTLWKIAREHNPGIDIREYICVIKKHNGMKTSIIYAGQTLIIPSKG